MEEELARQAEKKIGKFGRIQIVAASGGVDWKVPVIVFSLASSLLLGSLLVKQWNYAAVGRNVTNDVVKFLELNGSKKKKGVIEGGMLQSPMTVTSATTQIVARVLSIVNRGIEENAQKEMARRKEEEAAAMEAEKKKSTPKLCYDAPKRVAGKPAGTASEPPKHDKKAKRKPSIAPKPGAVQHEVPSRMEQDSGSEMEQQKPQPQHRMLFEPEDTRATMKGEPVQEIEPYTPPMPVAPPGGIF